MNNFQTVFKNYKLFGLNGNGLLGTHIQQRFRYILDWSCNHKLNKAVLNKYMRLPVPECKCQVKYVWIDGTGQQMRSKTRTLGYIPKCVADVPRWSFDGSSTGQAIKGSKLSDVYIYPVAMYKDPFRGANNKIVLCETYYHDGKPTPTNHRHSCKKAMDCVIKDYQPYFGLEQEYQLMDVDGRPFGWPPNRGEPLHQGIYYCSVGADRAWGRDIIEAHYRACLYAEVDIEGTNAEVTPGQWEFQVGVCCGIKAADDLWMGRFILWRMAEEFGVAISFAPKLYPNWNGAGCHANMSTNKMREEGGIKEIEAAIAKLSKKHKEHLMWYDPNCGEDNKARLTGKHETSSMEKFSSAVANRGVSVRIGRDIADKKKGHLEDRRPASNCDPYAVLNMLVHTILIDK